jgi:phospholipase/carboxylesterase
MRRQPILLLSVGLAVAACDPGGRSGLEPSTAAAAEAVAPSGEPVLRALERGDGNGPVVVLLHGYGSRPEDFLGFADRTDLPPGTRVILPYAPDSTHPPDGPEGGFMWWRFTGEFHDARALSIPALPTARAHVARFLDALQVRLGVTSDRIVLGGFSQGAMLALDFVLHDPRPLAGLVLLSGTFVDREGWLPLLPSRRGLRVYQSHGRADDVLYYPPAEELAAAMREAGIDVRFTSFDGAHEVTQQISEEVATFVRTVTTP